MKQLFNTLLAAFIVILSACSNQDAKLVKEIDSLVDSLSNKAKEMELKTFQNPESSETLTGYYGEDGIPTMLTYDSYPDFVQYFYKNGIVCIIHNVIGEEGIKGSESKYYYKNEKLFHYIAKNEAKEITPEIEKASGELLAIESEYLKTLNNKGKKTEQTQTSSSGLDFLNGFVDKSSIDVGEDERLTSRLQAIVKGEGLYGNLISQLAYGDAIQKFNDIIVINGQARQVIDEQGNQITFVSIIVADLKNNVLSVGMTDEEGNTSIFFTEAPGTKYPKQLVDWFTQDYRNQFKMEVQ